MKITTGDHVVTIELTLDEAEMLAEELLTPGHVEGVTDVPHEMYKRFYHRLYDTVYPEPETPLR